MNLSKFQELGFQEKLFLSQPYIYIISKIFQSFKFSLLESRSFK